MNDVKRKYKSDQGVWDKCAETYERQIVSGHPDIVQYELFEESYLDRILVHLATHQERPIKLLDIGCGSGRLHLRYGNIINNGKERAVPEEETEVDETFLQENADLLRDKIKSIWGIDFSYRMLEIAEDKLAERQLDKSDKLSFEQGSAFDLEPEPDQVLPVAVCLVNSIGVMQGQEGAIKLFKSMRRAVEYAGGIAIISCYQKKYIESYALNQYESTLDVSGQPKWLVPKTYAGSHYIQVPKQYKQAHDQSPAVLVDVMDKKGNVVEEGYVLVRDFLLVRDTIQTGGIQTYSGYNSNWYSYEQIEEWMQILWEGNGYHLHTRTLDPERAEPGQLVIYDPGEHLAAFH